MATRRKLSRLSLRLTRDLFFYEHILGLMTSLFMLTLMAMSFSIVSSVLTGPFFIYLLYFLLIYITIIFSPKRRYILCNKKFDFFSDWNISETWTRIKLKQLSKMLLGSFSEKKNALFWRERSFFFSVKQPCHRISSNFILSMFSREIYSKFYVVFTTYKNAKIKKTSWKI